MNLTTREAVAPQNLQNQLRRVELCILHRLVPELVPGTAFSKIKVPFLARLLASVGAICTARSGGADSEGPKAPLGLAGSQVHREAQPCDGGGDQEAASKEAGLPFVARLLAASSARCPVDI